MKNSHVFVLTACHNEKVRILSLLADLHKQTYKKLTTVVVDDGSNDGTSSAIKKKYPHGGQALSLGELIGLFPMLALLIN